MYTVIIEYYNDTGETLADVTEVRISDGHWIIVCANGEIVCIPTMEVKKLRQRKSGG